MGSGLLLSEKLLKGNRGQGEAGGGIKRPLPVLMVRSMDVDSGVQSIRARQDLGGRHRQTGEKVESRREVSQGSHDLQGHKLMPSCGSSDWQHAGLFSVTFVHKNFGN